MTFNARTATTIVMLALFASATLLALGLPSKAAFMPLLVGIPGTILCAWQLIIDLRRAPDDVVEVDAEDQPQDSRTETEVFLWLAVFAIALVGFGFVVGGPFVVAAYVRYSSRDTWGTALFAGAATLTALYGVFIWLLELPLFRGLVLEALL